MEITHLVVNGCSWSSGEGLLDPRNQAWPTLLANKLGCELVNLAVRGSSNDAITRRSYEYTYENLPNNSKPLYIVVFSQLWRREAWYNRYSSQTLNDYNTVDYDRFSILKSKSHPHLLSILSEFNEEDFYRRYIMNKLYLKSLLTANNFPSLLTHFPYDSIKTETVETVQLRFPKMFNEFKKIEDFDLSLLKLAEDFLPCGHPGAISQQIIADKMYVELIEKFGEVTVLPNQPFLRLKDFKIINPEYVPNHIKIWM
jgi:hypothetical protein